MKIVKRIGIIFLIVLTVLLVVAITVPIAFKTKITNYAKTAINENINATVDFESVSLSFFRSFPNLNFRLNDYKVVGKDNFENIPLAAGKSFEVAVNLLSLFSSPTEIKSIRLDEPVLNIFVLSDGTANYDIVPTTTTADTSSAPFELALKSYAIKNGTIYYNDQTLDLEAYLDGIDHKGKGNFTATLFDLDTKTEIASTTLQYAGIGYLDSVKLNLDAIFNIDLNNQKYALKDNSLAINELKLAADGFLQLDNTGENITLDFSIKAPENNFKDLLSLIPNAYTEDFKRVKANGTFEFNGTMKGVYNAAKEVYPAFVFNLGIENGDFKYPDLPLGISAIQTKINVRNPGGSLDETITDIAQFSLKVGQDPVEGRLLLKTPISNPDVDTRITANLDLNNLAKAYPLEGVKQMSGNIVADVTLKAKQSNIDNANYTNVNIGGKIEAKNVQYLAEAMPKITVSNALANFTPQFIDLFNFNATLGKSDIAASGKIYNPLAYLSTNQVVKGDLNLRSNYFNADEWLVSSETETVPTSTKPKSDEQVPDQYRFNVLANMKKLDYTTYHLSDLDASMTLTANDLSVGRFFTKVNGSDVTAIGRADNLYNFLYNNGILGGVFDLKSSVFDLDKLMATEETTTTADTSSSASIVPNYRYNIEAAIAANKVIYSPYVLTQLKGTAQVTEKEIIIREFDTKLYDGDLSGSGTINNYMEYVFAGDTVKGDLKLRSNFLNLNALLASEESTANAGNATPQAVQPEDLEAYILPANWNFNIIGNFDRLLYSDLNITDMTGKLAIQNGRLIFEETNGNALGGKLAITGGYDTQDPLKPKFDIKLDLQEVGIQSMFKTFNTFAALAPVGEFIEGKLNTTLLFSSVLGKDMMPDFNTINAEGFIQTLNAMLKKYKPFQLIGNQLQIQEFADDIPIQDSKNWFTVKDGTIKLEEAKLNYKDIAMTVTGTHSFNQSINYSIIAVIPREKLGTAANKGINLLETKAAQAGLNLKAGSHIKMKIELTGSAANPTINIIPLGTENGASLKETVQANLKEEIDNQTNAIEEEVKERLEEEKNKLENTAQKTIDSAKVVIKQQADSLKNEVKKKAEEAVGNEAKKIQEKIDKYNPFKKKNGN